MTRMYLSPTASALVKIALFFVECLIGLYNLITFPIRKINFKAYCLISFAICSFSAANTYFKHESHLFALIITLIAFTAIIVLTRVLYKYLNKKLGPKVALLINSPLGIPLKRFYSVKQ